jgi:hypothetical protein
MVGSDNNRGWLQCLHKTTRSASTGAALAAINLTTSAPIER